MPFGNHVLCWGSGSGSGSSKSKLVVQIYLVRVSDDSGAEGWHEAPFSGFIRGGATYIKFMR